MNWMQAKIVCENGDVDLDNLAEGGLEAAIYQCERLEADLRERLRKLEIEQVESDTTD